MAKRLVICAEDLEAWYLNGLVGVIAKLEPFRGVSFTDCKIGPLMKMAMHKFLHIY